MANDDCQVMVSTNPSSPIGVFDSGVGGLSVLRAIRQELAAESVLYLADQGHVPYGSRSLEEVRSFSEEITRFLINQGCKLVVVACNTASAAALHTLRQQFPLVIFVGMEPAIKPAAEHTQTGRVGVLATPVTFQGLLYASIVERFAQGVVLFQDSCPGLVAQVEAGDLDGPVTRQILERALKPMVTQGIDTIVLGCTHYPFVIPLIQSMVGPGIQVIDPAPAIARQVHRKLELLHLQRPSFSTSRVSGQTEIGEMEFYTTGSTVEFQVLLPRLLYETGPVRQLFWSGGRLVIQQPD